MNSKPFILLLSLFLAAAYCLLYNPDVHRNLYAEKWMIDVHDSKAYLEVPLAPSSYLLKLKHVTQEEDKRTVVFNGNPIGPVRSKFKKDIRTDYFYIDSASVNPHAPNRIEVIFQDAAPGDIDIRLSNYSIVPNEAFSYDVYVMFESQKGAVRLDLIRLSESYLFFLIMLLFVFTEVRKKRPDAMRFINKASAPFLIVTGTLALINKIPFIPYSVFVSPFCFTATFLLSFLLFLAFIVPRGVKQDGL